MSLYSLRILWPFPGHRSERETGGVCLKHSSRSVESSSSAIRFRTRWQAPSLDPPMAFQMSVMSIRRLAFLPRQA
jgi:hypothetical protein